MTVDYSIRISNPTIPQSHKSTDHTVYCISFSVLLYTIIPLYLPHPFIRRAPLLLSDRLFRVGFDTWTSDANATKRRSSQTSFSDIPPSISKHLGVLAFILLWSLNPDNPPSVLSHCQGPEHPFACMLTISPAGRTACCQLEDALRFPRPSRAENEYVWPPSSRPWRPEARILGFRHQPYFI